MLAVKSGPDRYVCGGRNTLLGKTFATAETSEFNLTTRIYTKYISFTPNKKNTELQ